ncbi:MAG: SDR family oxidoreductase [Candidatus Odinarchaeota archaeon]
MNNKGPVLITGTSTGIGRKITEFLASKGIPVYATARKASDIDSLNSLKNVYAFKLDVTDPEQVQQLTKRVEEEGKGLYGLVNNAGTIDIWPILATDEQILKHVFNVNVFGPHRVTRALITHLVESSGRIVNISSASGLATPLNGGAYSMSKYAVEAFSNALMHELRNYGVGVSVIEPTSFKSNIILKAVPDIKRRARKSDTGMHKKEIESFGTSLDQIVQQIANMPSPDKVAEACWDALFSKKPKRRYFVTVSPLVFKQGLKSLLTVVSQIYQDNEHGITVKDLHSLLDSVLEEQEEYVRSSADWKDLEEE